MFSFFQREVRASLKIYGVKNATDNSFVKAVDRVSFFVNVFVTTNVIQDILDTAVVLQFCYSDLLTSMKLPNFC